MLFSASFQVRLPRSTSGDWVGDVLRVVVLRLMNRSAVSSGVDGVDDVESTVVGDGSFGGGVGGIGVFSGVGVFPGTAMRMRRSFGL